MIFKHAQTVWLLPAVVAFVAPVAAGFWYAREGGITQQRLLLEQTAALVLERSREVGVQFRTVSKQLARFEASPCSDESLRAMRVNSLSHRYVQSAVYVENNQIICSSVEVHQPPFELGTSTGRNFRGSEVWRDIRLSWAPTETPIMVVRAESGFGVALDADEVFFGIHPGDIGILVLEYTEQGPVPIAEFGEMRPEQDWIDLLAANESGTFEDDGFTIHFEASRGDFTLGVLAFGLTNAADARAREQLYQVLPFTLAGGAVLAGLATQLFYRRRSFRNDIEAGIRQGEFFLEYQPIMDIRQQRCIGAEALIRWRRNGERIQPDVFIPLAEGEGVIHAITDEVFRLIARDMSECLQQSEDFYISINISGHDLSDPQLPKRLTRLLQTSGVEANRFLIEITESSFVDRLTTRDAIRALRQMGFQIAIDDFGTGFSNFAYLQLYDIDYLKIDRLFVETIAQDEVKTQLVFHLIELANKLTVEVIAEGVEQQIQADVLLGKGVYVAQGWLYSKAVGSQQLIAQLQRQNEQSAEV